jgi:type IV pilus assembly protein PilB
MARTLEDLLLEEGLLDEPGVRRARRAARHGGIALVRALVDGGLVDDAALAALLARHLGLPTVELAREPVDEDALREVPFDLADARRLLPLSVQRSGEARVIRIAMADPLDIDALDEIEQASGCQIEPVVARVGDLATAVHRHYRHLITQTIPRRGAFAPAGEPTTQPHHRVADEASTEVRLRALVDLLVDRGVVDRDAYLEAVRRLVKENAGE